MAEQRTVAVLGTGTIGASWTALFLAHGLQVRAWDPAPNGRDRLADFVEQAWPALEQLGFAPRAHRSAWSFHADPAEAVLGASFVQENAPGRLGVKGAVLGRLVGPRGGDATLASSASGLLPSDTRAGPPFPAGLVVGHPFTPPHLIPLVEVV